MGRVSVAASRRKRNGFSTTSQSVAVILAARRPVSQHLVSCGPTATYASHTEAGTGRYHHPQKIATPDFGKPHRPRRGKHSGCPVADARRRDANTDDGLETGVMGASTGAHNLRSTSGLSDGYDAGHFREIVPRVLEMGLPCRRFQFLSRGLMHDGCRSRRCAAVEEISRRYCDVS